MSVNQYLRTPQDQYTINGSTGTKILRDYRHASRIFVDGDFRLSPKYGFLFYVEFDFNPLITNISNTAAQELGMIVKNVNLPKFTIETKTHNAYNRVNIVQNKIKYDPVSITFHDDQADNVRNFWYDYYSFFFRDSDYADATYGAISKYQSRPTFDWGYSPRPSVGYTTYNGNQPYQYIQSIRIYSLYQKNFSEYQLINPTITSFRHGEHANGENTNLLQHEMTVQFETVKYLTGYTTQNTVGGYIDLHYDNTPSPIAPSEGTDIVDNGQGGYTRATDTITDLAYSTLSYTAQQNIILNNLLGVGGTMTAAGSTGAGLSTLVGLSTGAYGSTSTFGGVSIPSLGSLTVGVPSATNIQQTAIAGLATIAGSATSQLANGIVGSIASGLGTNGQAIVGLAASAISNPSAALQTIQNMALSTGMAVVQGYVNQGINYVLTNPEWGVNTLINQGITSLNENIVQPAINNVTGLFKDAPINTIPGISDPGANFATVIPGTGFSTGWNTSLAEGQTSWNVGSLTDSGLSSIPLSDGDLTSGLGMDVYTDGY